MSWSVIAAAFMYGWALRASTKILGDVVESDEKVV